MNEFFGCVTQHDQDAILCGLGLIGLAYEDSANSASSIINLDEKDVNPTLIYAFTGTQDREDLKTLKNHSYKRAMERMWADVLKDMAQRSKEIGRPFNLLLVGHSLGAVFAERIGVTLLDIERYGFLGISTIRVITYGGIGHSHQKFDATIRIVLEGDPIPLYYSHLIPDQNRWVVDKKGRIEFKKLSRWSTLWAYLKNGFFRIGKVHGFEAYDHAIYRAVVRYGEKESSGGRAGHPSGNA